MEVVDRYDARFDHLWTRAAQRFPILGERSAEFLNWRFADAPDARYRALVLIDGEDRLRGYLIYHFDGTKAHVADFLYGRAGRSGSLAARTVRDPHAAGAWSRS